MLLKKSSGAKLELQAWMKLAESQTGAKVKRFRSDRGGERLSGALSRRFKSKGIERKKSAACDPWQNGAAERISRALFDDARGMITHMKAKSKKIWAEAVAAANYLRARMLADCAPSQGIAKKRPNADHLETFGCDACILRKSMRQESDRALPGAMMGYAGKRPADHGLSTLRMQRSKQRFDACWPKAA